MSAGPGRVRHSRRVGKFIWHQPQSKCSTKASSAQLNFINEREVESSCSKLHTSPNLLFTVVVLLDFRRLVCRRPRGVKNLLLNIPRCSTRPDMPGRQRAANDRSPGFDNPRHSAKPVRHCSTKAGRFVAGSEDARQRVLELAAAKDEIEAGDFDRVRRRAHKYGDAAQAVSA